MNSDQRQSTRPPRLTRREAKARTRELLLSAAADVFAQKGYAGASVEDIADAAGYTTGALYSNFAGKEDLFLELMASRSSDRMANAIAIISADDVPIEQRRSTLAEHLVDVADHDVDVAALEAEFWLFAMRRPEFQARLGEQLRGNRDALSVMLGDWAKRHDRSGDVDVETLATILLGLFQGLVHMRRTAPDVVPDQLYATAIRWIFAGMAEPPDSA